MVFEGGFAIPQRFSLFEAGYTEAARLAFTRHLYTLADRGSRWEVALILKYRGPWLAEHPFSWSTVGNCLHHAGRHRECIEWMKDWKRPGATAAALGNLAESLRIEKRYSEAYEVNNYSIHHIHDPENNQIHHAILAAQDAVEGRFTSAQHYYDKTHSSEYIDTSRSFEGQIAEQLLRVHHAPPGDEREQLAKAAINRLTEQWRKIQYKSWNVQTSTNMLLDQAVAQLSILTGNRISKSGMHLERCLYFGARLVVALLLGMVILVVVCAGVLLVYSVFKAALHIS
ncbi:MAG: hypothetical protein ACAI35_01415 [Candidatus Methylacidiphilales bacterium]|nr:hypothetical protein [Candidatus Methylacidiphilales bacterium]